jgi:hypothetical protein
MVCTQTFINIRLSRIKSTRSFAGRVESFFKAFVQNWGFMAFFMFFLTASPETFKCVLNTEYNLMANNLNLLEAPLQKYTRAKT